MPKGSSCKGALPRYLTRVSWLSRLLARYATLVDERVEIAEASQAHEGALADVDLTSVPAPEPKGTPLERLERDALVSRDFRAAGKGEEWDRVRDYDTRIYGWPRNKKRGQARGTRQWDAIDTIVLHTAGVNGLHPDRWLGVPCHAAVANDATVVLCHDLRAYLWAAHAANRYSVSVEIAGNQTITPAQVRSARSLVRYMAEELRAQRGSGRPLYIIPHRFSHRSRVNDCGELIWRHIGEWAIDELGLELGEVVGSGRGLPW